MMCPCEIHSTDDTLITRRTYYTTHNPSSSTQTILAGIVRWVTLDMMLAKFGQHDVVIVQGKYICTYIYIYIDSRGAAEEKNKNTPSLISRMICRFVGEE